MHALCMHGLLLCMVDNLYSYLFMERVVFCNKFVTPLMFKYNCSKLIDVIFKYYIGFEVLFLTYYFEHINIPCSFLESTFHL